MKSPCLNLLADGLPPNDACFLALKADGAGHVFRFRAEGSSARLYDLEGDLIADEYNSIDWLREEYEFWILLPGFSDLKSGKSGGGAG